MPRGFPKSPIRKTTGRKIKTCGVCPCCLARKEHFRAKNRREYEKRKLSNSISDEELERRMLAKPLL